jgi:hypothetical protein
VAAKNSPRQLQTANGGRNTNVNSYNAATTQKRVRKKAGSTATDGIEPSGTWAGLNIGE